MEKGRKLAGRAVKVRKSRKGCGNSGGEDPGKMSHLCGQVGVMGGSQGDRESTATGVAQSRSRRRGQDHGGQRWVRGVTLGSSGRQSPGRAGAEAR